MKNVLKIVGKVLLVIVTTVVILAGTVYIMLWRCCNGPSDAARNMFVTTILETGQMKFLASWVCSDETLKEIADSQAMKPIEDDQDITIIKPPLEDDDDIDAGRVFDENGICVEEVKGRGYLGHMMIIKDPSQVCVAAKYPWGAKGDTLEQLVQNAGAVAGINGGLYVSDGNAGGKPWGVVVRNGEVIHNIDQDAWHQTGLWLIGINSDSDVNKLIIKDLEGMSAADIKAYVKEAGIRDAVTFQDEATDANNHFVPLLINGDPREVSGSGGGLNPRTAIGQRADGAILLFVTDGRGANGHLGASAADLISVMQRYGAVNAANLDGGSSTSMYYNGQYEQSSVTFYYQNASWNLPDGFVVMPKTEE